MKPLEDELREALRRQEPPPDLAERVLARIGHIGPIGQAGQISRPAALRPTPAVKTSAWSRLRSWLWRPGVRWALATAMACVLIATAVVGRQRVQRAKAEAAREQLEVALQLASGKLNRAFREVRRVEHVESGVPTKTKATRRTERL
ncbi:MAG: hypothetical protein ACLQOO_01550 [Terriglobia bacterium]